jgi:excisionase family DNA binding protein
MVEKRPMTPADILTVREAAAFLSLNPQSVYDLLRRGKLPGNKIGGSWRLSRSRLVAMINGDRDAFAPQADSEHSRPTPDPGRLTPDRAR